MSRGTSPVKLREWTERLKRFEKSNQTVADFCLAEAVSQPAFYHWRQRLAHAAPTKPAKRRRRWTTPLSPSPSFQAVLVTPPRDAATVRIRLPGGVVIELGNDELVTEKVIRQVLHHEATAGADTCGS